MRIFFTGGSGKAGRHVAPAHSCTAARRLRPVEPGVP